MANFDNMNPEKLMALAAQMGLGKGDSEKERSIKEAAERLSGKSDDELIEEVKKLKATLGEDKEKFKKQLSTLKMVRGMLNQEQKQKFDEMMKILSED